MDGFHISGGDPSPAERLVEVLSFLRKNGLNLQLDTNAKNASILERLLEGRLGDRVVMEIKGSLSF